MKEIESKFIKSCDFSGDQNFTQLRKDGNVYLYERTDLSGKFVGYETFIAKSILEGAPLPGGNFVTASYHSYPGAQTFGKTAKFCVKRDRAETYFNEFVAKEKQLASDRSYRIANNLPMRGRMKKGANVIDSEEEAE